MASIEKYRTKSGIRYLVRYRTTDRHQTKKRGFHTKKQAKEFLISVENRKLAGELLSTSNSRVPICQLGPDWLERKKLLKPSSWRVIESAWRCHVEPYWGPIAIGDIQHSEVQRWVTWLAIENKAENKPAKSRTTVCRALGVLAAILDDAAKDKLISGNAARDISLPLVTKSTKVYLTHEQVAQLAVESSHHGKHPELETLIYLLAYTGLRWGEAIALRVSDLDLVRHRIRVSRNAVQIAGRHVIGTPKTGKPREVGFPDFLNTLLLAQCKAKQATDLVFPGKDGGIRKTPNCRDGWFANAAKRAGLAGVTPHKLRHTAASLAISSGANVKVVQRMLGHASAAMTLDTYADLFDRDLDLIANALDIAKRKSRSRIE